MLTPTLTRFLVLLAWLRAAILSQLIFPVTFSTRKNWAMAIAKVWIATNPNSNSLPLYNPALGEISMNEPRRVCQQAVHTIIHPDPLTVFAFSISYNPSVTARNVPFTCVPYPFHVDTACDNMLPHPLAPHRVQVGPQRAAFRKSHGKRRPNFPMMDLVPGQYQHVCREAVWCDLTPNMQALVYLPGT